MKKIKINRKYFGLDYILLYINFLCLFFCAFGEHQRWNYPASCVMLVNLFFYMILYGKIELVKKTSVITKTLSIIWIMCVFSFANHVFYNKGLLSIFGKEFLSFQTFSYSMLWFISFYFSYVFSLRNNDWKIFRIIALLFFICGCVYNLYTYNRIISVQDIYTNNAFYHILIPLPLLFLNANRRFRYLLLTIVFVLVLLSLKRSGMIIITSVIILTLFYDLFRNKNINIRDFLLTVLIVIFIVYFVQTKYEDRIGQITNRIENISEDGGSGRDIIWRDAISDIKSFDVAEFLLGKGFLSFNIAHPRLTTSHNDFIEILYSYGIIALLGYIIFLIALLNNIFKLFKNRKDVFTSAMICFVCFLVFGLTSSMFAYQTLSGMLFSYVGVYEGLRNRNENILLMLKSR